MTGGNPFYLHQLLRAPPGQLPGSLRDTVVFSILDTEWPAVRRHLRFRGALGLAGDVAAQHAGRRRQVGPGSLGEVVDRVGRRRDIQLKGSGPTAFSRNGDGMAALGPVLREYIVSEAFAALGVPATRALAAVATGENVMRETMLPGAVFTVETNTLMHIDGIDKQVGYISTGGGAFLEVLEGKTLPAFEILEKRAAGN